MLILGEPGTGKQQIAKALYLNSPYNQNPFVVINCTTLNEKGWEFLFNSPSSPLLETTSPFIFRISASWPTAICRNCSITPTRSR